MIYFDYAAATPLDPDVKKAMDGAEQFFANPSATYAAGRSSTEKLAEARQRIGLVLGAKAEEIIFTSGGTEADNLAIFGLARASRHFGRRVITIATEHPAVLAPLEQLKAEGFTIDFCPVDQNGLIKTGELTKLITDQTILICLALASSEIGTIQPIARIAQIIAEIKTSRLTRKIKTPLLFHSDGSAAAGFLSLSVSRLGVDTLSLNAAKIYGPKGSGALFIKKGTSVMPQIFGGGQERGLRAGTENLAAAIGLATALEKASRRRDSESKHLAKLREQLWHRIQQLYPRAELNGHPTKRLANNLNISLPGLNGEDLVAYFDARDIAVATGAACQASSDQPSSAIVALNKTFAHAQSSLRLTLGQATTEKDINAFMAAFKKILTSLATIKA